MFWKHSPSSGSLMPSGMGSQQSGRRHVNLWHHQSLGDVGSVEGDGWEGGTEGRIMHQLLSSLPSHQEGRKPGQTDAQIPLPTYLLTYLHVNW